MKHLKLGCYSFIIDANELDLISGTGKEFTRDELPDDLKILFDILSSDEDITKPIFIIVKFTGGRISGYVTHLNRVLNLNIEDGNILNINLSGNKLNILYTKL